MTTLLDVHDLSIDIPLANGTLHAVRNIHFSVNAGETLCLVGESGCGKSLTAMAVMGLLPRAARSKAKRIAFNGQELTRLSERQMADFRGHRMSMIFQEPMTSLNPSYTIGNQLEEIFLRHGKGGHSEARARAIFLLERVGMTAAASRLRQYPHQLSGGLRQRVMIAMALMCGPALVIADEPTTALDVTIQAQILSLLSDLQQELKMGLILITHDLGVVARIADRVAVMYCGQVVETGRTVELFEAPLHPYTQGLMGCIPIPGKTPRGQHLGSIPGIVPTPIGKLTGCIFQNRCPHADDACHSRDVPLKELSSTRTCRCLRSMDASGTNVPRRPA